MPDEKPGCLSLPGNLIVPAPKVKGPKEGKAGVPIVFTGKSGVSLMARFYKHSWDFGDGTITGLKKRGLEQAHTYALTGTYSVRVREVCPWGFHDKWSKAITVEIK